MENMYVNAAPSSARLGLGSRRIFHALELRYLSPEARSVAYCLLEARSVPLDVTENAIQQAVVLGSMSGSAIDAQTFEVLFEAVTLNPAFRIPFAVTTSLTPSNFWVC